MNKIIKQFKDQQNDEFISLLKQWEQAAQMRKWTQGIKQNLSERIKVEVENAYRQEINDANPSAEPFTGQFSAE